MKLKIKLAALLMAICQAADAQTVWNVNVGNSSVSSTSAITTTDDYHGAASENTSNSTWNAVSSVGPTPLADSTGVTSAGVSFTITPAGGSAIDFGGQGLSSGDEIFVTWIKDNGNDDPFTVTFGNLPTLGAGESYALVIYSDWYWKNGNGGQGIIQTAGTGLDGTFSLNRYVGAGPPAFGTVTALAEDTDPANVNGQTNYARFDGLVPDGSNNLSFSMGDVNGPINGFQLVRVPPDPNAGKVWNVNFGNNIDESDDYVGAAPENNANSSWNPVTTVDFTGLVLEDSTGSGAAGVTMGLSGGTYGDYAPLTGSGDEVFDDWIKSPDNVTPYSLMIGNLDPSATYDLVIYSEWFWRGGDALPVAQTIGAGLAGTIYVNREGSPYTYPNGTVGPLLEDTDPADVNIGPTNWYRIKGLVPDVNGDLAFSMGGGNAPFNGFQLIKVAPPSPGLVDFTYDHTNGNSQVSIQGEAGTRYKLVEADDLDFTNPDQDPIPLTSATVGTLDGDEVIADGSGNATVQFNLGNTKDATFLRAQSVP